MNDEARMSNVEDGKECVDSRIVIRISSFLRHLSFELRHLIQVGLARDNMSSARIFSPWRN